MLNNHLWIERLRDALRRELPGSDAQRQMAPLPMSGPYFDAPPEGARRAAVMLLLYPTEDGWRLPLIVRPMDLAHHGGQIGLPGGLIEPGETTWQAAVRELQEEIGVPPEGIEPLGELSPLYVFVSNNHVSPWVAAIDRAPTLLMNSAEAAEVIELPVASLADDSKRGEFFRQHEDLEQRVPYFTHGSHRIWGATAMILAEFAAIVRTVNP